MQTWKNVIAGVDPEPESARAAALAWQIAEATGSPFHMVHVVYDLIAGVASIGTPPTMRTLTVANARVAIERALFGAIPDSALGGLDVRVGRPGAVLATLAGPSDLLVLGGKRRSGIARWLAGSTVRHVARDTYAPLLVTGESGSVPRRILAAVDLSEAIYPVLDTASYLAELFHAPLGILHVIEPTVSPFNPLGPAGLAVGRMMSEEEWVADSHTGFEKAVCHFTARPGTAKIERRGPITDSIRAEAARWNADLLVVGSHGKGLTERLLLGSTTQSLLDDLPSSMLIVPTHRIAEASAEQKTSAWPQPAFATP